ncbi:MAG TPA: hypothetical protein VIL74_15260 [Pyrinomonadaceae bacterium]|jgi:hypothetical protein
MDELNEVWEELLKEAAKNPQEIAGEGFAEFLAVKTANDRIRETSVGWLLDTMRQAAEHANRKGVGIAIETVADHRFAIDQMRLGGALLRFRHGVRSLTVEAGWTRAPGDGFMRGNALAVARISHFGVPKANAELHLVKFEDRPRWFTVTNLGLRVSFEIHDLIKHFQIFLGAV